MRAAARRGGSCPTEPAPGTAWRRTRPAAAPPRRRTEWPRPESYAAALSDACRLGGRGLLGGHRDCGGNRVRGRLGGNDGFGLRSGPGKAGNPPGRRQNGGGFEDDPASSPGQVFVIEGQAKK